MKIVTGKIVGAAFMLGVASVGWAQTGNVGGGTGSVTGGEAGAVNAPGVSTGLGAGVTAAPGTVPGAARGAAGGSAGTGVPAVSGLPGGARAAPALGDMRANGTSLNMNPDPRAPNVTGRPAPAR
ncbi:hypothetical protein AAGS40_21390 [Paraburkholderia sp. PREW-6R]|uniref:hypothetical protein n=1 Tax=Paraburkholderia sp. PREW-6R TaxID=3141544 RepID=UPI0031F5861F